MKNTTHNLAPDSDRVKKMFAAVEGAVRDILPKFPDLAVFADQDMRGKFPSITFRVQDAERTDSKKRKRLEPTSRRKGK